MDDQKKEHDLTLKKKEAEMERVSKRKNSFLTSTRVYFLQVLQEKVKEKFAPLIKKEKEVKEFLTHFWFGCVEFSVGF